MKRNWKRKIPLVILIAAVAFTLFSGLVMLLWNNILPSVFHIGVITFWQAAGILLLARLLFGGFKGRRPMMGSRCREKYMHMKWQNRGSYENEGSPEPANG